MTHDIFRTALLDGDAPEGLTEHLETCAECRLLDARLRVVDTLAPSLAGLPPGGLASRLAAPYSAPGTHPTPRPDSPVTDPEPLELAVAARPRRRTAWMVGISVAATVALVAGLVARAPSPEEAAQIVPIQNPEGIEPMEMTLVYEQIEEAFDTEGNRVGDPVVTEELAVPEGRRRVDDGVRRTTVRGGKRSVTLWKDDGIYLVEGTCPYKSPILDIRFPIQPERYPEQRGGWACEGQETTDFISRREVLHSETVTAAGRAWKTWVVADETVFDFAPDRPATGQSWFAPELGDYVKIEYSVVGPDGAVKRVSRALTELRSDTTDPRLEKFDRTPTGREIAISEGRARGHRWELLAYQAKSGECHKLKIGQGWGSSCSSVDRYPGLHVTASWKENPDHRSEGRSEFGSPQAPTPPSIVVYGITSRETDSVQIRFADGGAPLTVPTIAHRSFRHRFFVSELPEGRNPVEAVAISADGRDLQTVTHPSQWKTNRAKRTGPVKTVGRGELQGIGWELLAYARDDGSLCTSLRKRESDSGGSSCGSRVPGERLIWFPGGGTGPKGSTWHLGEADLSVAKVVADMGGSPEITVTTFGGDADFGISFYVFEVPQGSTLRAVTAFAADGTELERVNKRFPR